MRGEDTMKGFIMDKDTGSPPHARGRPGILRDERRLCRITPACAGKTLARRGTRSRAGDHPRMRGEDPFRWRHRKAKPGSPPHARGRPRGTSARPALRRITPACAGKTLLRMIEADIRSDHPRMRGEDRISCTGMP
mgnify:CR=1 FL=1